MTRLKLSLLPFALMGLTCVFHQANAASSQPIGIEAEDRAKIARIKANGGVMSRSAFGARRSSSKGSGDDADECSIDIGNIDTGGRRGSGPREVNIIIPGDIFQVNNRCR